ncbi:Na+/H+ antiporter NhaC family protein [Gaopeijia maritima]
MTNPPTTDPPHSPSEPPPVAPDRRSGGIRRWVPMLILIAAGAYALIAAPAGPIDVDAGESFGFSSALPALVTLVLVFFTGNVVVSLFLGIASAGFVIRDPNLIDRFLLPSIGSESFALILVVYLWALGGLIGIWTRTGGAQHFATWAGGKIVRGPRTARLFAWLVGIIFHQGGTISTILAGTTVRPVTDREKVSHEELTYIVDSTASPIATVIPLNAWPLYVAGLVAGTTPLFVTEQEAVTFFFRSIVFNFYGVFAVTMTLLFALDLLPVIGGRMRAARERARTTGQLNRPGSAPIAAEELSRLRIPEGYRTGLADFALPLVVLILTALTGVVGPLVDAIAAGDLELFLGGIDVPIAEAFGLAILSAIALALIKGMPLSEVIDGFVDGCKGVTIGALVLALAVTLGDISGILGTANFIVDTTQSFFSPVFLPATLLAICMGVAFSIGSSWGTYAVIFPIAMPLAYAIQPDPTYVSLCFGAVLGGAVFGDQCSPISDTTILTSLASGADVMDHVLTQIPLATAAAALSAIASTAIALVVV